MSSNTGKKARKAIRLGVAIPLSLVGFAFVSTQAVAVVAPAPSAHESSDGYYLNGSALGVETYTKFLTNAQPWTTTTADATVTNNGSVPMDSVTVVTSASFGNATSACQVPTLEPGASFTCNAYYSLTEQDVQNGYLLVNGIAYGTAGGKIVESAPFSSFLTW